MRDNGREGGVAEEFLSEKNDLDSIKALIWGKGKNIFETFFTKISKILSYLRS